MDLTFDLENIISAEEAEHLFDTPDEETQEKPAEGNKEDKPNDTTESKSELPLDETEDSESVGSLNEELDITTNSLFYPSIANALFKDGIITTEVKDIKTADDLLNLIDLEITKRFDERQKRIEEALNANVEPNAIKLYENTRNSLNSITPELLEDESPKGENLRRQILMKDYLDKGFTLERALRDVERSFNSGNDIQDAKEALESIKQTLEEDYNALVNEKKAQAKAALDAIKLRNEELKNMILSDSTAFGSLEVSEKERKEAFEVISKPVYKDPETGLYLTKLQKYLKEHPNEFYKAMAIAFVKTNGFDKLGNLVKDLVKKETKKAMQELENTLNHTNRTNGGSLNFASGTDTESSFKGYDFDI